MDHWAIEIQSNSLTTIGSPVNCKYVFKTQRKESNEAPVPIRGTKVLGIRLNHRPLIKKPIKGISGISEISNDMLILYPLNLLNNPMSMVRMFL